MTALYFVAGLFLVGSSFYILERLAGHVHDKLDEFMAEAELTNDIEKLRDLKNRVVAYAQKECWHRHFQSHAQEVVRYISKKIKNIRA
jgi:hypothetical protein